MITKKHNTFTCQQCGMHTDTLHEVFFGKHRKKAIKYNLQVPLCIPCHMEAHGTRSANVDLRANAYKIIFCDWLGLDKDIALLSLNTDYKYVDDKSKYCAKKIDSLLI